MELFPWAAKMMVKGHNNWRIVPLNEENIGYREQYPDNHCRIKGEITFLTTVYLKRVDKKAIMNRIQEYINKIA